MILDLNEQNINLAALQIRAGGICAFPTETVYGLGGDAFNQTAVAKIFAVKKRPFFDPLIIHIASLDTLRRLVDFSLLSKENIEKLDILSKNLMPGPLTLILPKLQAVPDITTGSLATAAVRMPSYKGALCLIKESGGGLLQHLVRTYLVI
ncbi:MAG: hypothetical protein Ta2B_21280 [Termitinemataceae bacterium]|nr:MAG: hypothetical protein Ta2B_21280 [Termitinemataceae bacterium]